MPVRRPGEVLVGHRPLGAFGRAPIYLPLADRFTGLQMVAPMGQAKTSTMEWLAYQDLLNGLSVFVVETEGDLGRKLLPQLLPLGFTNRGWKGRDLEDPALSTPLTGTASPAAKRL